ncbi:unnamed protein product, partial [Pelagomonas calceolata]
VRFLHRARLRPGLAVRRRRERVLRVGPGAVRRQGPLVTHVGGEPLGRQARGYCHFLGALKDAAAVTVGCLLEPNVGQPAMKRRSTRRNRGLFVRVVSSPRRCDGVRSAADVALRNSAERTSVLPR